MNKQQCIPQEPVVTVGILTAPQVNFRFSHPFHTPDGVIASGTQKAVCKNGLIHWNNRNYRELSFTPVVDNKDSFFELEKVTIGINFHWQREETQGFRGSLRLLATGDHLIAVNEVPVESYLTSVISSEMSATASLELLKAHAIISRSWLLHKMEKRKLHTQCYAHPSVLCTDDTLIRWYDHEAHTRFDVCADDHCQRYQGITRASTPQAVEAVEETRGEILTHEHRICDARFSKCCGGVLEEFQNCWENRSYPYLQKRRDFIPESPLPDLRCEEEAEKWIRSAPPAFCHTIDPHILSQVLNRYDQETTDFYRWRVRYTQHELSSLVEQRSGIRFGKIRALIPVERGTSGRLVRLKVCGTLRSMIIGKELEIRRILSPTHLYSSAFVTDYEGNGDIPSAFILTGAGWGHGVGLCQLGAAVMSEQGYGYREILTHYYPGSEIEKIYE